MINNIHMSELVTDIGVASADAVLLHLCKDLWRTEQFVSSAIEARQEVPTIHAAIDAFVTVNHIDKEDHGRLLEEQFSEVGQAALTAYFDIETAKKKELLALEHKATAHQKLDEFTSELIGQTVVAQALIKTPATAIELEQTFHGYPLFHPKLLRRVTGVLEEPGLYWRSDEKTPKLVLKPTGFVDGLAAGRYYIKPIDDLTGRTQVKLLIEP